MTPFHFGEPPPATPGERRIDIPAKIESKQVLLKFLAEAFPLPAYFGHNWDALEECLSDLEWMRDQKVALVHRDVPLGKSSAEQKLYVQILAGAATSSSRLRVFFPETYAAHLEQLAS